MTTIADEAAEWRRHLHTIPELGFDLKETSDFVYSILLGFGCDSVDRGVGISGLVAVIRGARGAGPTIALRADMDALPILEDTGLNYVSQNKGKMHACGHDGHTAMLLGAVKKLAASRDFKGTVVAVFQPAEEDGGGAEAMLRDRLIERYGIQRMYGMHNMPGLPIGTFATRTGTVMAGIADFDVVVEGKGGHAARPQETIDPIITAGHLMVNLQTLISRNIDPVSSGVLSITRIAGGDAYNVIPSTVTLSGTVRTLERSLNEMIRGRMDNVCSGLATASGATIRMDYRTTYPATTNHPDDTAASIRAARKVPGVATVDESLPVTMGGEDFSYFVEKVPGTYIFVGNGDSHGLHHPKYNFNDDAIPFGIEYWAKIVDEASAAFGDR